MATARRPMTPMSLPAPTSSPLPGAAVGLAGITMVGAVLRGGVDPFVFWVGLFLVVAFVARHVLVTLDESALQKSVEAWVPVRRDCLEDWIPLVGSGRPRG